MNRALSGLSLRTKLLAGYLLIFLVSILLGNLVIFQFVQRTISKGIEKELANTTNVIVDMVRTTAASAIKNHLRAIAEKNHDIVQHLYDEYRSGRLTEDQAKARAAEILLSQTVGKTGYLYCVDGKGVLRVHPKANGADLSKFDFIQRQILVKEGYLEYEWANPGEATPRKKALYMTYFGPWDWIISASSYRSEFKDIFRIDDFRESVLSVLIGDSGYPFVMDSKGNLVIHPKLQGQNIFESKDTHSREFIKEICERKVGSIIYPWRNPNESEPRDKLVVFNYIPEYDWIVASSGYLEEFNRPLVAIGWATLLTLVLVTLLVGLTTWSLSSSINRPIQLIIDGFSQGAKGDYSRRIPEPGGDELGQLAGYYNAFMDRLSESSRSLHASEEKFRLLFEHAVEGVFTMRPDGTFLSVNPSMARMLGYPGREALLRLVQERGAAVYVDLAEQARFVSEFSATGSVDGFETQWRRRDGQAIWVSLNARVEAAADGQADTIDGFCSDVSARKRAEEEQGRVKSQLEQRVVERTTELSDYIAKLERRNVQESLLLEMGELLQVCRTTRESFPVVGKFIDRFFPGCAGGLFLLEESRMRLEQVATWGAATGTESEFGRDECWALRHGKSHAVFDEGKRIDCQHVRAREGLVYLCVPITALGEILGLLHVEPGPESLDPSGEGLKAVQALATTFTNHLGLAFANLRLQDKLRDQSRKDPLTGLFNRRFMEEFAELEIRRIRRNKAPLSLLLVDVDHFKRLNDTYGHDAGDRVLKELAALLTGSCRDSDAVCRYGGEEFVLLLPSCPEPHAASRAEQLCAKVREALRVSYRGEVLSATISVGVATCSNHAGSIAEVLKAADGALYEAKRTGRDRVRVAPALDAPAAGPA